MSEAIGSVFVLGATGTVGRRVVAGLAARGVPVRAATRDPDAHPHEAGVTWVRVDLTDATTFADAIGDAEQAFVMSPAGYADAHGLVGPLVRQLGPRVAHLVLMTADGVEYNDEIPLRRLELLALQAPRATSILRPSWFTQNFATYFYGPIAARGEIRLPAGDARVGFVDARDIADAAVALLTQPSLRGFVGAVTGPAALTHDEVAAALSEAAGRPIRYQPIDDATFTAENAEYLPPDYLALLVALFGAVRAGAADKVADTVQRLTGHAPRDLASWARSEFPR